MWRVSLSRQSASEDAITAESIRGPDDWSWEFGLAVLNGNKSSLSYPYTTAADGINAAICNAAQRAWRDHGCST